MPALTSVGSRRKTCSPPTRAVRNDCPSDSVDCRARVAAARCNVRDAVSREGGTHAPSAAAQAAAYVRTRVEEVVHQMCSHSDANDVHRHLVVVDELLHEEAVMHGFTPGMILAGVPHILSVLIDTFMHGDSTIPAQTGDERNAPNASNDDRRNLAENGANETLLWHELEDGEGTAAHARVPHASTLFCPVEAFLPPLIPQVQQFNTEDGTELTAMQRFRNYCQYSSNACLSNNSSNKNIDARHAAVPWATPSIASKQRLLPHSHKDAESTMQPAAMPTTTTAAIDAAGAAGTAKTRTLQNVPATFTTIPQAILALLTHCSLPLLCPTASERLRKRSASYHLLTALVAVVQCVHSDNVAVSVRVTTKSRNGQIDNQDRFEEDEDDGSVINDEKAVVGNSGLSLREHERITHVIRRTALHAMEFVLAEMAQSYGAPEQNDANISKTARRGRSRHADTRAARYGTRDATESAEESRAVVRQRQRCDRVRPSSPTRTLQASRRRLAAAMSAARRRTGSQQQQENEPPQQQQMQSEQLQPHQWRARIEEEEEVMHSVIAPLVQYWDRLLERLANSRTSHGASKPNVNNESCKDVHAKDEVIIDMASDMDVDDDDDSERRRERVYVTVEQAGHPFGVGQLDRSGDAVVVSSSSASTNVPLLTNRHNSTCSISDEAVIETPFVARRIEQGEFATDELSSVLVIFLHLTTALVPPQHSNHTPPQHDRHSTRSSDCISEDTNNNNNSNTKAELAAMCGTDHPLACRRAACPAPEDACDCSDDEDYVQPCHTNEQKFIYNNTSSAGSESKDADETAEDECGGVDVTALVAMTATRAVRTLALPHPESSVLSSVQMCSSLSMDLLWWLLHTQPARIVQAVMYGSDVYSSCATNRATRLGGCTVACVESNDAHTTNADGNSSTGNSVHSRNTMDGIVATSKESCSRANTANNARDEMYEDGTEDGATSTTTTVVNTAARDGAHHHRSHCYQSRRRCGHRRCRTHRAAAGEDVMTDMFQALVHQLNASYKAWHRELRNDVVLWVATVLHHGSGGDVALAWTDTVGADMPRTHYDKSPCSHTSVDTRRAIDGVGAAGDEQPCVGRTCLPQPVSSATMNAMSAMALVVFDLVCGAETREVARRRGGTDAVGQDNREGAAPRRQSIEHVNEHDNRDTYSMRLDTDENDEDGGEGVHALLTRHALRQYTLRFHGVTSPALRQHNLLFKRAGWQLLGNFCRWQAAQIRLGAAVGREGDKGAGASDSRHDRGRAHRSCGTRVTTVDLLALGLVDVLLLYLHPRRGDEDGIDDGARGNTCSTTVAPIPSVAAWTLGERATLQREAWEVLMTLVETSAAHQKDEEQSRTSCQPGRMRGRDRQQSVQAGPYTRPEDGVTCIEISNQDEDEVDHGQGWRSENVAGGVHEMVPVVGAENFILQAGGLAVVLSHLPIPSDGENTAASAATFRPLPSPSARQVAATAAAAAPQAMKLLAALARVAAASGPDSVSARLLGDVQLTLIPHLVSILHDISSPRNDARGAPTSYRAGKGAHQNVFGSRRNSTTFTFTIHNNNSNSSNDTSNRTDELIAMACLSVLKSLADLDPVAVVPLFCRAGGASLIGRWFAQLTDNKSTLLVLHGRSLVQLHLLAALCDVTRALILRGCETVVADFVAASGLDGVLNAVEALVVHWATEQRHRVRGTNAAAVTHSGGGVVTWSGRALQYTLTTLADLLSHSNALHVVEATEEMRRATSNGSGAVEDRTGQKECETCAPAAEGEPSPAQTAFLRWRSRHIRSTAWHPSGRDWGLDTLSHDVHSAAPAYHGKNNNCEGNDVGAMAASEKYINAVQLLLSVWRIAIRTSPYMSVTSYEQEEAQSEDETNTTTQQDASAPPARPYRGSGLAVLQLRVRDVLRDMMWNGYVQQRRQRRRSARQHSTHSETTPSSLDNGPALPSHRHRYGIDSGLQQQQQQQQEEENHQDGSCVTIQPQALHQIIQSALGLGVKVYAILAAVGFERLRWDSAQPVDQAEQVHAREGKDTDGAVSMEATAQAVSCSTEVTLSAAERAELILVAALPMMCKDELHAAMAQTARVLETRQDRRRSRCCEKGTELDRDDARCNNSSGSGAIPVHGKDCNKDDNDCSMRPTTADARGMTRVMCDATHRARELWQLASLNDAATRAQDQVDYDRFLVSRLRQPHCPDEPHYHSTAHGECNVEVGAGSAADAEIAAAASVATWQQPSEKSKGGVLPPIAADLATTLATRLAQEAEERAMHPVCRSTYSNGMTAGTAVAAAPPMRRKTNMSTAIAMSWPAREPAPPPPPRRTLAAQRARRLHMLKHSLKEVPVLIDDVDGEERSETWTQDSNNGINV